MLAFHREKTALLENKYQIIPPTTILASLVIHKILVSDVFIYYIDYMK